jgi:hypothetical protein
MLSNPEANKVISSKNQIVLGEIENSHKARKK